MGASRVPGTPPECLVPPVYPRTETEELRARRDEEFRELQVQNQQLQQELEATAQVGAHGRAPSGIGGPWGGVLGVLLGS